MYSYTESKLHSNDDISFRHPGYKKKKEDRVALSFALFIAGVSVAILKGFQYWVYLAPCSGR